MTDDQSLITAEMKAMIGKELKSWTATEEVSRSDIRRYTQAVMDDNPLYCDEEYAKNSRFKGIVAPGAFPVRYSPRRNDAPDPLRDADPDWHGGSSNPAVGEWVKLWPKDLHEFNAGSELEVFQHARPGDIISSRDVSVNVYEKVGRSGKVGYFVIETTYANQRGEVLCKDRQFHVMRPQPKPEREE